MNVHIIHPVCLKVKSGPPRTREAYSRKLEISIIRGDVDEFKWLLGVNKDALQELSIK